MNAKNLISSCGATGLLVRTTGEDEPVVGGEAEGLLRDASRSGFRRDFGRGEEEVVVVVVPIWLRICVCVWRGDDAWDKGAGRQ